MMSDDEDVNCPHNQKHQEKMSDDEVMNQLKDIEEEINEMDVNWNLKGKKRVSRTKSSFEPLYEADEKLSDDDDISDPDILDTSYGYKQAVVISSRQPNVHKTAKATSPLRKELKSRQKVRAAGQSEGEAWSENIKNQSPHKKSQIKVTNNIEKPFKLPKPLVSSIGEKNEKAFNSLLLQNSRQRAFIMKLVEDEKKSAYSSNHEKKALIMRIKELENKRWLLF